MIRQTLLGLGLLVTAAHAQDVMLMNRIGPSASELYVANLDGTGEHKLVPSQGFDYHASYSPDGKWITFTSERTGYGQADIYRVHPDGSGMERLTDDPAMDDAGVLSPDGKTLAFVSTRGPLHRANVWLLDLATKKYFNLTGQNGIQGDLMKPDGFFKPAWSPDGKTIAFSSDRNTDWKGHDHNAGWEHIQELAIYTVNKDGSGLKRLTPAGITSGSPKFSPDGKYLIYYVTAVENSWSARVTMLSAKATSQIVAYELATGNTKELTTGDGLKLAPQMLPGDNIAYQSRAGASSKVVYSQGAATVPMSMRSPSWSPDGKLMIYEKVDYTPRPQWQDLYSWTKGMQYRYTDVFPSFAKDGTLVVTAKDSDSSIATMHADGSDKHIVFKSTTPCSGKQPMPCGAMTGVAFAPSWSPDGQALVFGFGGYLIARGGSTATIMMAKRDGSDLKDLTAGKPNAGFPSWSSDGKEVVYRTFAPGENGLRIINLETKQMRILTSALDNVPGWQPGGDRIVFTRKENNNFDIYTIKSDGTDLKRLTTYPATDAHAVWSYDGKKIMWDSGEYGFKDEAALYDNSFQPYGSIWSMNPDGSDKKLLTDSHWEDAMPCFVPPAAMALMGKK